MSLVTLTMTLLTGFVLLAPVAMVAVLVSGGVAARRAPAVATAAHRIPAVACACGDSGCGRPALSRAA